MSPEATNVSNGAIAGAVRATEQPSKKPKREKRRALFVLFEGTGNDFQAGQQTNVCRMLQLLRKDDEKQQLVYYGEGVGMHDFSSHTLSSAGEMGSALKSAITKGFASSFPEHVLDAYRWLMNVHRKSDEIYVMGFSRGAYAAGCFCGLLETIGLLPRESSQILSTGWEVYKKHSDVIHDEHLTDDKFNDSFMNTSAFRSSFSKSVKVHFLGLWDTVASIGNKYGAPFAFPQHEGSIRHVYHAMALDEQRNSFMIQRWNARQKKMRHPILRTEQVKPENYVREKADVKKLKTFVNEVWFPGVHSDVGGGNNNDKLPHLTPDDIKTSIEAGSHYRDGEMRRPLPSLGLISLRWMLRAILWSKSADVEILIDPRAAARFDLALSYDFRQADASKNQLEAWPAEHLLRFFELHTRDGKVEGDVKKAELVRALKESQKIPSKEDENKGQMVDNEHMGIDIDRKLALNALAQRGSTSFAPKTEVELSILRIVDAFNVRSSDEDAKKKAIAYLMAGFWSARESPLNIFESETKGNLRDILAGDKFHVTVKTRMLALRLDDARLLAASGIPAPHAGAFVKSPHPSSLSEQAGIVWGSETAENIFERLKKGGSILSYFGTKTSNEYLPYSTPPVKDGKAITAESCKNTDDHNTRLKYGKQFWQSLLDDPKYTWVE